MSAVTALDEKTLTSYLQSQVQGFKGAHNLPSLKAVSLIPRLNLKRPLVLMC